MILGSVTNHLLRVLRETPGIVARPSRRSRGLGASGHPGLHGGQDAEAEDPPPLCEWQPGAPALGGWWLRFLAAFWGEFLTAYWVGSLDFFWLKSRGFPLNPQKYYVCRQPRLWHLWFLCFEWGCKQPKHLQKPILARSFSIFKESGQPQTAHPQIGDMAFAVGEQAASYWCVYF